MKHDLSPIQYQTPSILHPNKRAKEQKQLSKANKEKKKQNEEMTISTYIYTFIVNGLCA